MTCESCGDKPKKCNKDFATAVVEINNPEQITLMRRVVIPATMGDDTTVPPAIGKYRNVLLYYEANHKSYLYSSDGIPTLLANGLTNYEEAVNLPQINSHTLIGDKTGDELGLQEKLTAGDGIEIDGDNTISISDIEQYAHFFDTVADMKAATNLVAGDYVRALGYYNINDGGASIYKIVNNDELADDGGSVIELDSGLKATLVVNKSIRISQFGVDGNHNTNINNFITYVNSNNLIDEIEFEPGVVYELDLKMAFTKKDLKINGNGATIKISDAIKRIDLFNITATNSCKIQDIVINGDEMPQDQWNEQVFANMSLRTCFRITSPNIIAENIRIKNVWGQGIFVLGYESVDIHDCIFDKIGGDFWYHDAQTGAFDNNGDGIYFSGHEKDANISITNCTIIGYQNSDSTKNDSRCGIVFENLAGYTMSGITTNMTATNTIIKNFSRPLHHEAYTSLTHMVFENCQLLNGSCIIASNRSYTDLRINNSIISWHEVAYLGSTGISSYNCLITNSEINLPAVNKSALSHNSDATYRNCTINGVYKLLNENGYRCLLEDCTLNFNDSYSGTYLSFSSRGNLQLVRCTLNKASIYTSNTTSDGSVTEVNECTFNNIFPNFKPHFNDLKTVFNFSATPNTFTKRFYSKTTIYINNVLTSRPNINEVLPATDYCFSLQNLEDFRYGTGNGTVVNFNGENLPIIPATLPFNITLKKNSKYIMIMFASNDWTSLYSNNFSNVYYTDLTFNASGVASVGTINTKGTIPSANELTFSGNNVSGTGASTNLYMVWILPYEYKDMLGLS